MASLSGCIFGESVSLAPDTGTTTRDTGSSPDVADMQSTDASFDAARDVGFEPDVGMDLGQPDMSQSPCDLVTCADDEMCDPMTGRCDPICEATQAYCDGTCVNIGSDPANCGGCAKSCDGTLPPNAHTRNCTNSACVYECDSGRADIDGDLTTPNGNGCEAMCTPSSPPVEVCDGIDNDCNGAVDDNLPPHTYYADNDGDGYGDPNTSQTFCDPAPPTGWSATDDDCNDGESSVNPAGQEVCNDLDDDCNGAIDDTPMQYTWWLDSDGDGVGGANTSVTICAAVPPMGYVATNTDCDDGDPNNFPGNVEICDMQDNNCNNVADDGAPMMTYYQDSDGDTWGSDMVVMMSCMPNPPVGYVVRGGDCNDGDMSIHPMAPETCDGVDSNCSGDMEVPVQGFLDQDNDGYGGGAAMMFCSGLPSNYEPVGGDCDDQNNQRSPGLPEVCDGLDNDCNAATMDRTMCPQTIFVTTGTWQGNVNLNQTADAKCAAAGAGIAGSWGSWKAIIYDGTMTAAQRIRQIGIVQNTGNLVVFDYDKLFNGDPLAPIGYDQNGTPTTNAVWTGTSASGGQGTTHCSGFASASSSQTGRTGTPLFADGRWLDNSTSLCNKVFALYCIDGQE